MISKPRGVPVDEWERLLNLAEEFRDARAEYRAGNRRDEDTDLDEMAIDLADTFVRLVLPPAPRTLMDVLDEEHQEHQ